MRRTLAAALAGAFLCLTTGCLVTAGSSVEVSGTRVTDATFNQVEPGTTTEAWLVATLGAPAMRTEVEGNPGISILRYDYREVHRDGGTVFLLFSGKSKKEKVSHTFFELADGVVQRYWTER